MNEPMPQGERQVLSPDWLAHRYDPGHDTIHFVHSDRATRRTAPFLIDQHLVGGADPMVVLRTDALAVLPAESRLHFVFHSAYCCSTLFANALDLVGYATTLKEPTILNDLVGWRHRGASSDDVRRVLNDVLRILARPFASRETVIIKPSNVVNGLAPLLMETQPNMRSIFMHAPLAVYLGSIASKGMWGRLWVRDLLVKQLRDDLVEFGFSNEDYLSQTDLQVAAIGWLAQHKLFHELACRWPDRIRLLDSELLLAHPSAALTAASELFELRVPTETIATVVASGVFTRNAKDGRAFDRLDRIEGQRGAADIYGDEIAKVVEWARAVAAAAEFDLDAVAAPLHLNI